MEIRLEHPNSNALFQVLKEHADDLGLTFYRSGFATATNDADIATVVSFIRQHERQRVLNNNNTTLAIAE